MEDVISRKTIFSTLCHKNMAEYNTAKEIEIASKQK